MAFSSSPPLLSYSNSNNKYTSTPHTAREEPKPKTQFSCCSGFAPVCRFSLPTLFSFIFLISFSSSYFLTFCSAAASNPIPTPHSNTNIIITSINITPSPSPSTTSIKTREGIHQKRRRRRVLIITLSVFVVCLLSTMACLTFLNFKRRSSKRSVEDVQDHQPGTPSSICSTSSSGSSQSKKMNHHKVKKNKMFANNNPAEAGSLISSSVPRRFTWEEIEGLTMNFSSRVIGQGGFSTLYLSHFSDSILGALKIHGGNSERLHRMFKQELEVLLHIQRHRNIVNLLGYCDEREQGALVFEYIRNGTLYDKLHNDNDDVEKDQVLSWKSRMSIAFQLAQAIEYLHEECKPQIVHGDIKSSNILLDDQLNPKLCDFGFSKMGFSSTIIKSSSMNPIMASPGYMDPLYLRTGIASKKNDVYSFGVIILELVTGIEAFCSEKQQLLTSIAGPIIRDANKVAEMMDPRLLSVGAGDTDMVVQEEEAKIMATISAHCLRHQSSLRPSMSEIIHTMRDKISF